MRNYHYACSFWHCDAFTHLQVTPCINHSLFSYIGQKLCIKWFTNINVQMNVFLGSFVPLIKVYWENISCIWPLHINILSIFHYLFNAYYWITEGGEHTKKKLLHIHYLWTPSPFSLKNIKINTASFSEVAIFAFTT